MQTETTNSKLDPTDDILISRMRATGWRIDPPESPRKKRSWWSISKGFGWKILVLLTLGVIVVTVTSEGGRIMYPVLSQKLSKVPVPGFSQLRHYANFDRLDLAHVFAVTLGLFVFVLWTQMFWLTLAPQEYFRGKRVNEKRSVWVVLILSLVLLGTDLAMFYVGMTNQATWGLGGSWFSSLLATVAYGGVLIFVSLVNFNIQRG